MARTHRCARTPTTPLPRSRLRGNMAVTSMHADTHVPIRYPHACLFLNPLRQPHKSTGPVNNVNQLTVTQCGHNAAANHNFPHVSGCSAGRRCSLPSRGVTFTFARSRQTDLHSTGMIYARNAKSLRSRKNPSRCFGCFHVSEGEHWLTFQFTLSFQANPQFGRRGRSPGSTI